MLDDRAKTPIEVSAAPPDKASFIPVERAIKLVGIFQSLPGNFQGEKMIGIAPLNGVGHNAKF